MDYDILIGVHAYSKCKHGKTEQNVILDRLNGAYEIANTYKDIGAKVCILYLGGRIENGKTTAEKTVDIAKNNNHKLISEFDMIIADEYGCNTKQELKTFIKHADKIEPRLIVSVSSQDHVSRIMRNLLRYQEDVDYGLTVYASNNKYTTNELEPFILEGTYPKFIKIFQDIFTIDSKYKQQLSTDVQKLFKKYK